MESVFYDLLRPFGRGEDNAPPMSDFNEESVHKISREIISLIQPYLKNRRGERSSSDLVIPRVEASDPTLNANKKQLEKISPLPSKEEEIRLRDREVLTFKPTREQINYLENMMRDVMIDFTDNACDRCLSGPMMTRDEALQIADEEISDMDTNMFEDFVGRINYLANNLLFHCENFDGTRHERMIFISHRLMHLFCLAFADMCCQVKGLPTLVDIFLEPHTQLIELDRLIRSEQKSCYQHIRIFPRLCSWISMTVDNVEYGNEVMSELIRMPYTMYGDGIVQFMTARSYEYEKLPWYDVQPRYNE